MWKSQVDVVAYILPDFLATVQLPCSKEHEFLPPKLPKGDFLRPFTVGPRSFVVSFKLKVFFIFEFQYFAF